MGERASGVGLRTSAKSDYSLGLGKTAGSRSFCKRSVMIATTNPRLTWKTGVTRKSGASAPRKSEAERTNLFARAAKNGDAMSVRLFPE
jgi:hypothetical protein